MRIAFIVASFPAVTETFIINQIADLEDRGYVVDIFAFKRGETTNITRRYEQYKLRKRTRVIAPPRSIFLQCLLAPGLMFYSLLLAPTTFLRLVKALLNQKIIKEAFSLKYLFWTAPFIGRKYDLIHCHFGTVATKYVRIRNFLGDNTPLVTTLYGYDISHTIKEKGAEVYIPLHKVCDSYIVMSQNMKQRAILHGFPEDRITVLPVSISVDDYPYATSLRKGDEPAQLMTIARLVEKKGIDDLLKAASILKKKSTKPFHVTIIGDGPLRGGLEGLCDSLGVRNEISFVGAIAQEEVIRRLRDAHIYVQPSKTAANGDME